MVYAIFSLTDEVLKLDKYNPSEKQRKMLEDHNNFYLMCLYIPMALDWYLFFQVLKYFSTFDPTPWNLYNLPAFILILATTQSYQVNIGHEISHKAGTFNRIIGTFPLVKNLLMHFPY